MEQTPSISVIVTAYNVAPYIGRCMQSILEQDFADFELIIVNDGSTDNTRHVIQEHAAADPRVRIVNQENGGVSSARNRGIRLAQGDYIWQIDGDDWIDAGALTALHTFVSAGNYDIVVTDIRIDHSGNTEYVSLPSKRDKAAYLGAVLDLQVTSWPPTRVYRRRLLTENQLSYPEHINYSEDFCLDAMAFYHATSIGKLDASFYHYVRRDDSLTGNYHRHIHSDIQSYHFVRDFLAEKNLENKYGQELEYLAYRKIYLGLISATGREPWHRSEYDTLKNSYPKLLSNRTVKQHLKHNNGRGRRFLAAAYQLNYRFGTLIKATGLLAKHLLHRPIIQPTPAADKT